VDTAHSHAGIDFVLGGMSLDLQLSVHLNGEEGMAVLHRREGDPYDPYARYVRDGSGFVDNGRLRLDVAGILPGEYQVEFVLGSRDLYYNNDNGERFWMPGIRDREASPWYDVGPGQAVHLDAAVASEPAWLTGSVTGAWLEMGLSPGPQVSLVTPDSVVVMGARRVEDDGSFALPVHTPGPVKILVSQRSIEQWVGGPGFNEATVFDLNPGQTVPDITLDQTGINFVVGSDLSLGWSTVIRVYDRLGEALLATMRFDGGSGYHIGVPNLWPGEFLVHVSPSWDSLGVFGWRPQWWDRADDPTQARPVVLGAGGDIVRLDLMLEAGGSISGEFTGNPAPVYRYYVYAVPVADPTGDRTFRRSEYEGYEIKGLPEGGFKVGVLPVNVDFTGPDTPGFIWYPGTADWDQAEVLIIENANSITGIDFEIP
jgi:hypothetical protein